MEKKLLLFRKEIALFSALFFGISLAIFWLFNGGAYAKATRYRLWSLVPAEKQEFEAERIIGIDQPAVDKFPYRAEKARLLISKIFIEAPVVSPRGSTTEDILSSLEDGVGLYPGSTLPGENGRTVLLGHSSRATWYRGKYATIFALLHKLERGDVITITQGSKKYLYEVFAKNVFSPGETNRVLAGPPETPELALVTCYPVGSAASRTVVQARLVAID